MQKLLIIQILFNYCRLIEKLSYSAIAFFQSILRSIHERATLCNEWQNKITVS